MLSEAPIADASWCGSHPFSSKVMLANKIVALITSYEEIKPNHGLSFASSGFLATNASRASKQAMLRPDLLLFVCPPCLANACKE
jgi:hypothetical protein